MSAEYDVWFTDDADEFLDRVGEHLAEQPVTGTVVTTTADRIREVGRGDLRHCWFAVVADAVGELVGIAMRTAPFAPYPVYVLGMPDAAAAALARALLARGEDVGGVGGMRPAADVFAETIAAATGRRVVVGMHHQLFELGTLVDPRPVAGRLRPVREDEAELALGWVQQFFVDADEQAGRADAAGGHGDEAASFGIDELRRRLAAGVLWFWVDDDDQPVCIAGANPPAFGVARIGPVYTPRPARSRGWAGAAVAEVSRLLRSAGARVILFADHANPTSTSLYRGLGFEVVADTVRIDLT